MGFDWLTKRVKRPLNQKGIIGDLMPMALGITGVIIVVIVGVLIATQTYTVASEDLDALTNEDVNAAAQAAVLGGFESFETFGDFLPIVVIVAIAAIILGLLAFFTQRGTGRF